MDKNWEEHHLVIKTGHFYNATRDYKIYFKIRTSNMWPGTGDYEDEPETKNDKYIDCFFLEQSMDNDFKKGNGGRYFETIEKTIDFIKNHTNGEIVFDD